jgi:hypothetical protein
MADRNESDSVLGLAELRLMRDEADALFPLPDPRCAICGLPGHRYGSTDDKHEASLYACINGLKWWVGRLTKGLGAAIKTIERSVPRRRDENDA